MAFLSTEEHLDSANVANDVNLSSPPSEVVPENKPSPLSILVKRASNRNEGFA